MLTKPNALVAGIYSSLAFVVLNVAMNIYMKWLFEEDGGDFAFPWTMLAVQQIQVFFLLQPMVAAKDPLQRGGWFVKDMEKPETGENTCKGSWRILLQVFAVTVIFCMNVGLNSLSLVQISVTLNQTTRAFLPVGVLFLATVFEQRTYPSHSYITTFLLVGGIVITCWGCPDFNAYGFTLALISTIVAAVGTSINGRLLSKGPFSKSGPYGIAQLMLLQSVPAAIMFSGLAWLTERHQVYESLTQRCDRWQWYHRVGLVSVSSALALLSNLGRCFLVAATSALMETLAGNAKVAALCAIDHALFGTDLLPFNYVGISVTFLGFSVHVLLQYASQDQGTADDQEAFAKNRSRSTVKIRVRGSTNETPDGDDMEPLADMEPLVSSFRKKTLIRPRLISAADTGLAAEHIALDMGRETKKRTSSTGTDGPNDGPSTALNRAGVNAEPRDRCMTWTVGVNPDRGKVDWMGVDLSLLLEVPVWLDSDYSKKILRQPCTPAATSEEFALLAGQTPRVVSSDFSPGAHQFRLRFHTDPTASPCSSRNEAVVGGAFASPASSTQVNDASLVQASSAENYLRQWPETLPSSSRRAVNEVMVDPL